MEWAVDPSQDRFFQVLGGFYSLALGLDHRPLTFWNSLIFLLKVPEVNF